MFQFALPYIMGRMSGGRLFPPPGVNVRLLTSYATSTTCYQARFLTRF